jgi:hypothetical protein
LRKRKLVAITAEEEEWEDISLPVQREAVLFHLSIPCRCEVSAVGRRFIPLNAFHRWECVHRRRQRSIRSMPLRTEAR